METSLGSRSVVYIECYVMDSLQMLKTLQGHDSRRGRVRLRMTSPLQKLSFLYALLTFAFFLCFPHLEEVLPEACVSAWKECSLFSSSPRGVAGDFPSMPYSEADSSDPRLAVKGKFAAKCLPVSSLLFMVYLVYHRPGTA